MKKLKLKFIETGRISSKKMNLLFGGTGWSCSTYTNCHETGKNSCKVWAECDSGDTDKKTVCDNGTAYLWLQENPISL